MKKRHCQLEKPLLPEVSNSATGSRRCRCVRHGSPVGCSCQLRYGRLLPLLLALFTYCPKAPTTSTKMTLQPACSLIRRLSPTEPKWQAQAQAKAAIPDATDLAMMEWQALGFTSVIEKLRNLTSHTLGDRGCVSGLRAQEGDAAWTLLMEWECRNLPGGAMISLLRTVLYVMG